MANKETEDIWPLTICADRYGGAYSGGRYIAWHCYPWEIPIDPYADDMSCVEFWQKMKLDCVLRYATGDTPEQAAAALARLLGGRTDVRE